MRATSSLPVPLSPVTSTGASLWATISIRLSTRRMPGDCPMSMFSGLAADSSTRACSSSRRSARCSAMRLTLHHQLVDVERLGQVVVGALLQGGDRVRDLGEGGDEDDLGVGRLLAHAPEQGQPVELGRRTSQMTTSKTRAGSVARASAPSLAMVGPGDRRRAGPRPGSAAVGLVVDEQDVQPIRAIGPGGSLGSGDSARHVTAPPMPVSIASMLSSA